MVASGSTDRPDTTIVFDLRTSDVLYEAPDSGGEVVLSPLLSTTAEPENGWTVSHAVYNRGAFVQLNATDWVENNPMGPFTYREFARDEWSAYLTSTQRADTTIQIDLYTGQIMFEAPDSGGEVMLSPVVDARPEEINGWLTREVVFTGNADGTFTQIAPGVWMENGRREFREWTRDEWSVYIEDPTSPDVRLQLDLFHGEIFYEDAGVARFSLYDIVDAR